MIARLLVVLLSLVSFACFAVPMYVIRPFRHQGASELTVALFVKQVGPALSAVCALAALAIVILSWRRMRAWSAVLLLALAGAYLSRVNVYEHMFHHLNAPQFERGGEARLDKDDMVIAIRLGGEARAYPIREMAYHHVVNDTVGRQPVVSTY